MRILKGRFGIALIACAACAMPALGGDKLSVVSVEPAARSLAAPIYSSITIHFDEPVDQNSFDHDSFRVFGRWSGTASGVFTFSDSDRAVTLDPDRPFIAGELVLVTLSRDLRALDGDPLRSAGYSFTFTTRVIRGGMSFPLWQEFSTNRQGESSIPYGMFGSDLNHDGWPDISVVNEDTNDLRIFMNAGDGLATFDDFTLPTTALGNVPSPSDPADFNNDGHTDAVIANTIGNSVSILLGNGDGTFDPQQQILIGGAARGLAVLDFDGDGDPDVAATCASQSRMALLTNNGAGVFGAPSFFEGGSSEEWALGAADMNEDGILDLVVGARSGQRIIVHLGNGNGTFAQAASVASGGRTWVLNVVDVNNDGHEDVLCANSSTNGASVLLGNGAGGLSAATTYPADSFPLSTDAGDLDADGDVDWVLSSYSGDWWIYTNDGDGTFTFNQELPADIAASCSLLVDIDLDGDLDITLVDEIADELIIRKNGGTHRLAGLAGVQINVGSLNGGGLDAIRESDDLQLLTRSGFGQTFLDLHNMTMTVDAHILGAAPLALDITIESGINQPSGTALVSLRNWNANRFDQIGSYSIGQAESVRVFEDVPAAMYVGEGGEIRVQIKQRVFVPIFAFRFDSFFDHVGIEVD